MVKKNAEAAPRAPKKAPAVKKESFKAPVDETGKPADVDTTAPMTSAQALAPDKAPKEGDTRYDEATKTNLVYHDGKWFPAPGQAWGGDGQAPVQPTTKEPPAASGWGTAADADAEEEGAGIAGDQRDDSQEPAGGGTVGWGLDGRQQIVDEEGEDASEASKVKKARRSAQQPAPPAEGGEGHNLTAMSKDLVAIVERAERQIEEISAMKDDLKEIMSEAKQKGYSTAIIREAIRRRAMDPDKRKEHDDMLSLYEEALKGH